MEDIYEALVSGAPSQAQLPAIVDQLRRRRSLGELGAITGDRVLSPFGSSMIKQSDAYAGDIQDIRQKDADNAQTKDYQDRQLKHMEGILNATLGRDKEGAAYRKQMAEAAKLRAQAALLAAQNKGAPKMKNLTGADITKLDAARQQRDKIRNLKSTFKDEYASTGITGQRTLSNTLARAAPILATEKMKEAQNWWRQMDIDYTLPVRNKAFGATLSTNEQNAWKKASAGAEMSGPQVKLILDSLEKWQDKEVEDLRQTYRIGFNPQQVDTAVGMAPQEEVDPTTGTEQQGVGDHPEAPPEAIEELMADPTPEAIQEFVEVFGMENLPAM